MRKTRIRARLISEYVDARFRRQPSADAGASEKADRDFDELLDLTRDLSRIQVVPPRAAEDAVLQRLARELVDEAGTAAVIVAPRGVALSARLWARPVSPAPAWLTSLGALAAVVLGLLLVIPGADAPLTAADLLARADRLDAVVARTEVLYREVRDAVPHCPG